MAGPLFLLPAQALSPRGGFASDLEENSILFIHVPQDLFSGAACVICVLPEQRAT